MKHLFLGGPLHGTMVDVQPGVSFYMHPVVLELDYMPTLQHVDIRYERALYQRKSGQDIDVFIAELAFAEHNEVEQLIREHNL